MPSCTLEQFLIHISSKPVKQIQFLRFTPICNMIIDYTEGESEYLGVNFYGNNPVDFSYCKTDEKDIITILINKVGTYICPKDFTDCQERYPDIVVSTNLLRKRFNHFFYVLGEKEVDVKSNPIKGDEYQHGCESRFFTCPEMSQGVRALLQASEIKSPLSSSASASIPNCNQQ
jgi:hypothetical protein